MRKGIYINPREAGRIGLSDIPSDSKEMLLAGERTKERPRNLCGPNTNAAVYDVSGVQQDP